MGHYKRKKKILGTRTKIIKRKNNFSKKNNKKIVSVACDQKILSFLQSKYRAQKKNLKIV